MFADTRLYWLEIYVAAVTVVTVCHGFNGEGEVASRDGEGEAPLHEGVQSGDEEEEEKREAKVVGLEAE